MQDAMDCASRIAKVDSYLVKEYPEKKTLLEQIMNSYKKSVTTKLIKEEIGVDQVRILKELKQVKQMIGVPQTRLPFMVDIN